MAFYIVNTEQMEIQPIAYFHSPLTGKFGIPRQSGIAGRLVGEIHFCNEYRSADAVRGMDSFDYLWLIWGFSENVEAKKHLTVRPPRLGGNKHVGVFASRSSFRPNNLALSSVRLLEVDVTAEGGPIIKVAGADLMDGTPIYDIKPYITFTDSHAEARSGFVDTNQWQTLDVEIPQAVAENLSDEDIEVLKEILEQDPRPQYHDSENRVYGMEFRNSNVKFRVEGSVLRVLSVESGKCGV